MLRGPGLVHTDVFVSKVSQHSCEQDVCAEHRLGNAIGMYKIISDDTCFEKTANSEELERSKCGIVWSFSSFMGE